MKEFLRAKFGTPAQTPKPPLPASRPRNARSAASPAPRVVTRSVSSLAMRTSSFNVASTSPGGVKRSVPPETGKHQFYSQAEGILGSPPGNIVRDQRVIVSAADSLLRAVPHSPGKGALESLDEVVKGDKHLREMRDELHRKLATEWSCSAEDARGLSLKDLVELHASAKVLGLHAHGQVLLKEIERRIPVLAERDFQHATLNACKTLGTCTGPDEALSLFQEASDSFDALQSALTATGQSGEAMQKELTQKRMDALARALPQETREMLNSDRTKGLVRQLREQADQLRHAGGQNKPGSVASRMTGVAYLIEELAKHQPKPDVPLAPPAHLVAADPVPAAPPLMSSVPGQPQPS